MELGISLDVTRRRVPLNITKVSGWYIPVRKLKENSQESLLLGNFNLLLWTDVLEVLVPKDEHFSLSSIKCELIKPCLAQLRDLDSLDFCTDVWTEVIRSDTCT